MKIAVIGGGIGGCAAALALAKAGHTVTVFEKDKLGGGASSLALGGLFPYRELIKTNLARVQRESIADWPRLAAELGRLSGVSLKRFFIDYGEAKQVKVEGLFEVWRKALQKAGVGIEEGVEIRRASGLLKDFDGVLVAAGWGTKKLAGLEMTILEGQAVCVRWPGGVEEPLFGEGMYVLPGWGKDEVLIGSSKTPRAAPGHGRVDDKVTVALMAKAGRVVPGLERAEIVRVWVGYRPFLRPVLPLVRGVEPGVFAVTGLGSLGFCLAPAIGVAAAEAFS